MSLEAAQKAAWEKLHTGYWKDVPQEWRDAYGLACLLAAGAALLGDGIRCGRPTEVPPKDSSQAAQSLRQLDMGLLMGGPKLHASMDALATAFQDILGSHRTLETSSASCPSTSSFGPVPSQSARCRDSVPLPSGSFGTYMAAPFDPRPPLPLVGSQSKFGVFCLWWSCPP